MELLDSIRFLEIDYVLLSSVIGGLLMDSAKESIEQQSSHLMDAEAASQLALYENESIIF